MLTADYFGPRKFRAGVVFAIDALFQADAIGVFLILGCVYELQIV